MYKRQGILASRVVSGFVGEVLGWREMYFIAAGMMLLCAIVVLKVLPDIQPTFQGKYSGLMKSLFSLVRKYPSLRIYSIRAGLAFGSFLAMWSCLAFKMGEAPFHASSDVIGILGPVSYTHLTFCVFVKTEVVLIKMNSH